MIVRSHNRNTSAWAKREQVRRFVGPGQLTEVEQFSKKMHRACIFQDLCSRCQKPCKVVWGHDSKFTCFAFEAKSADDKERTSDEK
jgi:hypothetical protein